MQIYLLNTTSQAATISFRALAPHLFYVAGPDGKKLGVAPGARPDKDYDLDGAVTISPGRQVTFTLKTFGYYAQIVFAPTAGNYSIRHPWYKKYELRFSIDANGNITVQNDVSLSSEELQETKTAEK